MDNKLQSINKIISNISFNIIKYCDILMISYPIIHKNKNVNELLLHHNNISKYILYDTRNKNSTIIIHKIKSSIIDEYPKFYISTEYNNLDSITFLPSDNENDELHLNKEDIDFLDIKIIDYIINKLNNINDILINDIKFCQNYTDQHYHSINEKLKDLLKIE